MKTYEARLSPIIKSTIFRVIQEALTNVSRHAETPKASVMIAMRNGSVDFSVRDGGKGFEPPGGATDSNGLSGMRERISLVGGHFEVSSSPGLGTIIRAHIPLTAETKTTPEPVKTSHKGKRIKV